MNMTIPPPETAKVAALDPALHRESSLREKIIEHVFMADLLRALWRTGKLDIEVLRPEVDRGGYDIVLHCNGVIRHVQLKSSYREAATSRIDASLKLADKPSGCIIWIMFDQMTLEIGLFLWFGGAPGEKVPAYGDKIAQHSRPRADGKKADRPGLRVIKKSSFAKIETMPELISVLFG